MDKTRENVLRNLLKWAAFLLGLILSSPMILLTKVEEAIFGKSRNFVFGGCKEILSLVPTILGVFMRSAFYWAVCKDVSPKAYFIFGSWLAYRDNIIGSGVVIGAYTFIGYANIERNVSMGARVSIISGKYQHGRPIERVDKNNNALSEENNVIHIGENTWIGQDATIMANIGKNCTVGAGSVVLNEVPDNTTVLGNPARRVNI